jgi:Transposase IS4
MTWSKDIVPAATQNADTYVQWGAIKIDTISQSSDPVEVFRAVSELDKLVQGTIVPQSNLYALQNGRVFETHNDEIMAFFGINYLMGYHVLPSLDDYWSNEADICVPFVSECMPRARFREIRNNLHFSDNAHFNEAFAKSMENTECQSIDENMVKFKGRNAMKQYMKNKPIKWGFKMWARCCSKTGYLFQFDYYTG